jgi:hypothetical protein
MPNGRASRPNGRARMTGAFQSAVYFTCGRASCVRRRRLRRFELSLMGDEHVIYDADRKRRVIISGSPAGYGFVEEHFSDDPIEMCWIPQTHRHSVPICSSFEIALREARGRIEWLAAATDER